MHLHSFRHHLTDDICISKHRNISQRLWIVLHGLSLSLSRFWFVFKFFQLLLAGISKHVHASFLHLLLRLCVHVAVCQQETRKHIFQLNILPNFKPKTNNFAFFGGDADDSAERG